MAGTTNRVFLSGSVNRTPKILDIAATDRKFARFSMSTTDTWFDRLTNTVRERRESHNIVVFNDFLVQLVDKHVRTGSRVLVEGSLQTRSFIDEEGKRQYATEVVLGQFKANIELLDVKPEAIEVKPGPEEQNGASPC